MGIRGKKGPTNTCPWETAFGINQYIMYLPFLKLTRDIYFNFLLIVNLTIDKIDIIL